MYVLGTGLVKFGAVGHGETLRYSRSMQQRSGRTMGALLGLCLAALPATLATGQEPVDAGFGERLEVEEVLIDVLVTDRRGSVILGLGGDDFEVREDGEPVELESVTFYSDRRMLPSEVEVQGAEIETEPQRRTFLWLIQDQRRAGPRLVARQLEAGRAAAAWIRERMGPLDRGAVLRYDVKLEVHQDLTADHEALAAAVERASQGRGADGNWPSRRPPAADGPSLLRGLPAGTELRRQTGTPYDALTLLARAARGVPGRKILVFLGRGFGRLDERGRYEREARRMESTLEELNDANVAVYPVDLSESGTRHAFEGALSELATATGGEYLRYFTGFAVPLRQIAEANSGFYLLSYRSRHPAGSSGFQEVEVRVVNPDLEVRARRGYLFGG